MGQLKLWSQAVLPRTQVSSGMSILTLSTFRDVLNPPYCQDVTGHTKMIQAADVNRVLQILPLCWQTATRRNLLAGKTYVQKRLVHHLFAPHWSEPDVLCLDCGRSSFQTLEQALQLTQNGAAFFSILASQLQVKIFARILRKSSAGLGLQHFQEIHRSPGELYGH